MTTHVPPSATNARSWTLLLLASLAGVAYLLTALLGVWAAYDRAAAWERFALLAVGLVAALAIALLGQLGGERLLALVGLACAWAAALLAAYFLLTFDWQASIGVKAGITFLYQAGLWIQAHRPALPVAEDMHRNVAGGALALLTPLGAGAVAWCLYWRRYRPLAWISLLAVLLAAAVLLLTVSRGALLGLALGAAIVGYLAWRRRAPQRWRRAGDLLFVLLGAAAVIAGLFLLTRSTLLDSSTASRPQLWQWAIDLIADYPFTGSGLGSTMMVHATYLLILHVGFIPHMHNLVLQIGIEQGIPGMVAFLALLLLAGANLLVTYQRRGSLWLIDGALVALAVLVVHGMFDAVPFYSRLAPVTFIPLGFALGLTAPQRPAGAAAPRFSPADWLAWAALLAAASLAVLFLLRPVQAAFQANLGAVAQSRAELASYTWPAWPIQDALRRSPQIDLGPALARYQAALASDPRQASANRRLGQIELSQGAYDAARRHLETAYAESPQRHANRYLLGESYAIDGLDAQAIALWRSVSSQLWWEEDWLARAVVQGREYWYGSIGEPQRAEALKRVREQLQPTSAP